MKDKNDYVICAFMVLAIPLIMLLYWMAKWAQEKGFMTDIINLLGSTLNHFADIAIQMISKAFV